MRNLREKTKNNKNYKIQEKEEKKYIKHKKKTQVMKNDLFKGTLKNESLRYINQIINNISSISDNIIFICVDE